MSDLELSHWFAGNTKSKAQEVTAGRTHTYIGIALSDSSNGYVTVDMGGDNVSADESQGFEIPCVLSIKEGDKVVITVVNGSPIATGIIGWGDYIEREVDDAGKTATNYMNFGEDGLVIGNMLNNVLGRNVRIDADSVDVRDGEKVVASFGETTQVGEEERSNIKLGKYTGVGFSYNIIGRVISGQYSDVVYLILSNTDGSSTVEFTEQYAESLHNDVAVFNGIECKNSDLLARFGDAVYGDGTKRTTLESSHPLFITIGGRVGCKATPILGQYILIDSDAVTFSHPALWLAALGAAAESHNHSASDINSGILGIANGGTGKSSITSGNYLVGNGTGALAEKTPSQVLSDIGAAGSSHNHAASDITSGTFDPARLPAATSSAQGALSANDKTKLDRFSAGADFKMYANNGGSNSGTNYCLNFTSAGNLRVDTREGNSGGYSSSGNYFVKGPDGKLTRAKSTASSQITMDSGCTLTNIYTNIAGGAVVTVVVRFKFAEALTAQVKKTIGTLAEGLRPYDTTQGNTNYWGDIIQVTSGGVIEFWPNSAIPANEEIRASFTYVLN